MNCAWQEYLNILPLWLRQTVDKEKETMLETRLRLHGKTELVLTNGSAWLDRTASDADLQFCINTATKYSPWSARTAADGYITAPGGHRIGICGDAVMKEGKCCGIREPTSVCIRVSRDFPGIAKNVSAITENILIAGAPGAGKTTFLRDLIRCKSEAEQGSICVVDERREIFPSTGSAFCFPAGKRTDILGGCDKRSGIEMVLRSMTPMWIAVDEITAQEDCQTVIHAGNCGVRLIATVHAACKKDLYQRVIYRNLIDSGLFTFLVLLKNDRTLTVERI